MRKQDMGNQFSKKTRKKARSIQAQRIFRSRWFKSLVAMGSVVVFCTVYSLIIPAATLTENEASADAGIVLEEATPSEPQPVEAPAETPAPEPVQEEASEEEPVVQAAVEETPAEQAKEAPAAASSETATETPAEAASTAASTEQSLNESAAAGSGSEETKTENAETANTAAANETAPAEETSGTVTDETANEGTDTALTTEETTEEASTADSEEPVEETSGEEEEVGTVSELKGTSGNLEAVVRFAEGAGIPENATLAIYGGSADTGKVQDALWSGSMDSIEQSTITTDLSEYVSFAVKDVDGNDITPDSDCSIEISFGSEADLSDPGENKIKKYGTLVVGSDGNVSVTGTSLSTGDGHTYATFSGKLSGNTFGFAVTTADKKVNYLEGLSGKTSDGAVEASLTFGKDAKVPEGSTLTVEGASVSESSVLNKLWGNYEGVDKDTVTADDVQFVKFVIRDKDGKEISPETKVSVNLTFHHEADLSIAAEGKVKKYNALAVSSDGTITLGSKALSAENGTTTASFADISAKSSLGYAVSSADKKVVYATRLTGKSEDGTIEASLRLTEEAKIPEGSLLKVTPVTGKTVQKTLLDNIWTDTSIIDPDTIELTDSGLAAVTITDKDGNALKPEADGALTLTFNKEADLKEAARKMVKRAKAVAMTEENVKLSDDGLNAAEGKTKVSYTGIVDGQTFGYAVSTAKQKTNFLEGKLTYEGEDYTIEVSVNKDNQIPEGSELKVKELDQDSEEFKKKLDQAAEAVQKDAEKKSSDDIETSVDDASVRMFDITILNEDGDEIQPNGNVRVSVKYKNAVKVGADAKMKAVHFDEKNDEVQVLTPETKTDTSDTEKKVHEVRFNANGFSVYAIVGTEIQKEITLTTPDGKNVTYVVSVTYGSDAQIPDGSTLEVVEFEPDSDVYKEVRNLLFSTVDTEPTDDSEPKLEMVDDSGEVPLYSYTTPTSIIREIASDRYLDVLDISIKDADGHEVEPEAAVQVSIRMKKAPEGIDAQTVADTAVVQHLDESSGELVIETVASADESVDGTVLVANEGVEASFEVESFSRYTFTYGNGNNRRSVTVHYVDESGNELAAPNPEPAQNNGHSHLVYDIEGYDFVKTTINSASGTQISPYIQYRNFGQWHNSWGIWYQDEDYHWGYRTLTVSGDTRSLGNWTALNNNQDVYVVYRKKTTPPQGGESVPVVPQGEWPEFPSGDNTKPTKTSVENGDGTNTLSLTVTGAETPLTSGKVKAQVIVVFDLSGSMNYRMGSDTDPGYGEHSRLYYSKEAVESLTNALGTNDKLDVEMALVTFSNYARTAMGFTNVSSATGRQSFISTVDGLSATGGTNWEAALREANYIQTKSDAKTYVIFVSDGAPTFRISRGSITESNIAGNVDDGDAYYMSYGIYGSGGATHDEDRSFALAQATSIVNSNKTFYTVALTDANDTTHASEYMGDLNSRAGGAGNYSATSPEELANVINAIGTSITTELGFADIEIHDGITDLTNLNAKVLQSVDENSFKYYRYGGENNKYGTESNPSAWGNDPADSSKLEGGANKATYDSSTGAVEWKMGSDFQLEDGVTYKVSFKVWPDQDAYDWIAKLRNGTVQYANLPADVKPQIDEATLSLKTNTDAYVRYKKSSTTSGDTTTTGNPIQVDYNPVKPMPLPAQSIPIEKIFINELDPERYENEPVRISLTGDGDTFAVVNLNDSNNFKTSAFISYGLMTPDDEPVLKEPGHDFVLTELSAYHWDLEAGVYRPMIIGGERKLLQKVDSGGDYTIDGKQYKELADGASISATNYRRSNLNLTKNIVDKDGQTSINDKYPNQLFEYTITVNSSDGEDVWFSVQTDPDDYTTVVTDLTTSAHPELDEGGNPKNNGYFYEHNGESITVSLKPTWNLRFTNLPKGSTYTIVETSTEGFEFDRASLNPAGDDEQFTVTESTATVTGVVAEYSKQYQITYTNRSTMLDIVVIKTDDAGTSIPGATFNLLKKDGSSYHAIPNRDDLANFSIPVNGITLTGLLPGDYELEEVTPPDGYIIIKKETFFNLSDSDEVIKLSDESKDIASTSGEKKDTVSIKNQPGQALPNTGGPGTIPYTLGGIALIMASALMYGFRMRRRERRLN